MRPVLITGGAGFIGTNLADRLLSTGQSVIILDNLSRRGVEQNLRFLQAKHPHKLQVEVADIRDAAVLARIVPSVHAIYHFAAQTAVTTSLVSPEEDFDVNARGTLQLLEAARACKHPPFLLYTSTNKVYGGLSDVALQQLDGRYVPADAQLRATGISERRPLDFHTPYGCSKGTADQYVLDYARGFELPATVFRMSCIYGPHQCGTEDQGWVAHFALRALARQPISIYGDGQQVRDLLFVEDLVDALLLAGEHVETTRGQAYNIGGGVPNTASLRDVISVIERFTPRCEIESCEWRPSDQRYYVSDTWKFRSATGWNPKVDVKTGIERMLEWMRSPRGEAGRGRRTRSRTTQDQSRDLETR